MNCADRAISLQGSSSRTDAIADSHGSRKPTTSGSRLPNCRLVRGAGPSRDTAGYATEEEILSRFRAVPKQDVTLPYIGHHIAVQSVRKTDNGWVWKFDPDIFGGHLMDESPTDEELLENTFARIPCRVGYLRCENGVVPPPMAAQIRSMLQLRGPFVELAEAGHHPMLDQPLPLVATIRTLLEFWSIT